MHEPMPEDEDKRLELMFRELSAPIEDDGFSDAVMRRVSRTAWRRTALLTFAGAIGAVFAVQPLMQVLSLAGHEVAGAAGRWHELAWLIDKPVLIGVGLLALLGPAAWQWLED
jgi:hypothetical protein